MDSTTAANATAHVAEKASASLPQVDTGTMLLTTMGYLALLLGVIFLAYYLLKRFGIHGGFQGGPGAPRLLSRLMLGNRQSVVVVRFRGRDMVLGVTEERINLLRDVEADESIEPQGGIPQSFASFLKRSKEDAE